VDYRDGAWIIAHCDPLAIALTVAASPVKNVNAVLPLPLSAVILRMGIAKRIFE
jgi:hypothetical protein